MRKSLLLGKIVYCLIGAAIIIVAALLTDCIWYQISCVFKGIKPIFWAILLLSPILALTAIGLYLVFRCRTPDQLSRTVTVILLFSFICRIGWVLTFDSYQVNDFGRYFNCAVDVVRTGDPGSSTKCDGVYWKRAAFYTYPVVLLFGPSLLALKLTNAVLATLASCFFFLSGRIIYGPRVAAIGLLFFSWHPDLWYSMTLASHDIPGMLLLGIFFYLTAILHRTLSSSNISRSSIARLIALSFILGMVLFLLGFIRSYQWGAILAMVFYLCVELCNLFRAKRAHKCTLGHYQLTPFKIFFLTVGFFLVIPVIIYEFADHHFRTAWTMPPAHNEANFLCYFTAIEVLGISQYSEIANWCDQLCPQVNQKEKLAYSLRKLAQDLTYSPREYFSYLRRKNRELASAEGYLAWSTFDTHETWDVTYPQVKHLNTLSYSDQANAIRLANAALLFLVLCRLISFPRIRFTNFELIPIFFCAIFYGLFLLLLESQPRYAIFLAYLFPFFAAQIIIDKLEGRQKEDTHAAALDCLSVHHIYIGGAAVLALTVIAYFQLAPLFSDKWPTLRDQSGFVQIPSNDLPHELSSYQEVVPSFPQNSYKRLLIAYQNDITIKSNSLLTAERSFSIKPGSEHHLRFFVSTCDAVLIPGEDEYGWPDVPLKYFVALNGHTIATGMLDQIQGGRYFSFYPEDGITFSTNITIQFIVQNLRSIDAADTASGPVAALEYIDAQ
jgi:hypothetical protein